MVNAAPRRSLGGGTEDFVGMTETTKTIAPEKMARLMAFLGALPPIAARKLFGVLELDKAIGGEGLPYTEMLAALRDRLFKEDAPFPKRPVTAQRLFFEPFEDFFIAQRSGKKRRARIARSSIAPIWALIQSDPACVSAARASKKLDEALAAGAASHDEEDSEQSISTLTEGFFNAAGQGVGRIVSHAQADETYRAHLSETLGGAAAFHDLLELQLMLSGASHLTAMQQSFPKPVSSLTEEDYFKVRQLYAAAHAEAPNAAPYVLLCLSARMDAPWRALGVYYHLTGSEDEALRAVKKDAAVIPEVLFDDLEGMARSMERDASADFHAAQAGLLITHFADFADGMQAEARRSNDGVVVNRVEACRDVAADALERFTEQSAAAMRMAMPVRHAGGSSRLMALRPDIGRMVSPTLAREGREAADFLARINETSKRLNRKYVSNGIIEETREHAVRYANDLVLEIRAAEGEERTAARRLMDQTLSLITPLVAADEVGLIRDRASAAAKSV